MWKLIKSEKPPSGQVVKTKIEENGISPNERYLKLAGNLWFLPDSSMYVYYTPTHWWDEMKTR